MGEDFRWYVAFGVEVAVCHEFEEVAGFAAFGGLDGLGVVAGVDVGLGKVLIDVDGVFDYFLAASFGDGTLAHEFDCLECVFVGLDGALPVALGEVEVAEVVGSYEMVKGICFEGANF